MQSLAAAHKNTLRIKVARGLDPLGPTSVQWGELLWSLEIFSRKSCILRKYVVLACFEKPFQGLSKSDDAEFGQGFAQWRDMDTKRTKFVKSPNRDMSKGCPGVQDLASDCPGVQDLSSGCPGRQVLPQKRRRHGIMHITS